MIVFVGTRYSVSALPITKSQPQHANSPPDLCRLLQGKLQCVGSCIRGVAALPSPTVTFGFILATLIGALFHLVVGGDFRRLALYLLCSWAGFGLGHVAGTLFQIETFNIGTLRAFPAIMGSLIALIVALSLSSGRARKRSARR
jgi:hypothetical protein